MWSNASTGPPDEDISQDFTYTSSIESGTYVIQAKREFDTGDSADFVMECDKSYEFTWSAATDSASAYMHNTGGWIYFDIDADCNVINFTTDDAFSDVASCNGSGSSSGSIYYSDSESVS